MYPDHKIYRKSAIRFSLVQRFRAIISEEESKRINKTDTLPTYKQGSELMGAKIAQPDYADPQKLFPSINSSQLNLDSNLLSEDNNLNGKEQQKINQDVPKSKKVFDSINLQTVKSYCIDTGQKYLKIKSPLTEKKLFCDNKSVLNSSQCKSKLVQNNSPATVESRLESNKINENNTILNDTPIHSIPACSDSYYEKILEHNLLNDEKPKPDIKNNKPIMNYEKIQNNKNIVVNSNTLKSPTDISGKEQINLFSQKNDVKKVLCTETKQPTVLKPTLSHHKPIRRPLKPPPPVPAKPLRLSQIETNNTTDQVQSTKGWVKTVVGRFE